MASPLGPAMMESLEGEGEAIRYLASLPPAQRAREMGKLEGYVYAKQHARSDATAYEPQPRTHHASAAADPSAGRRSEPSTRSAPRQQDTPG